MRFLLVTFSFLVLNSCSHAQNFVLTESVLKELDYFDSFMSKFNSSSSDHIYVLRIDTSSGARKSHEHHFLLSTIYTQSVSKYINPKYGFWYKARFYLVKTDLEIDFDDQSHLKQIDDIEKQLNSFFDTHSFLKSTVIPPFQYCFFFKSYGGEVKGGMSIGSCEPYLNSSESTYFFYNNDDIERVERKKY